MIWDRRRRGKGEEIKSSGALGCEWTEESTTCGEQSEASNSTSSAALEDRNVALSSMCCQCCRAEMGGGGENKVKEQVVKDED